MAQEQNMKWFLTTVAGAILWGLAVIVGLALVSGPISYLRLFLVQGIAPQLADHIAGTPSPWWLPGIVTTAILVTVGVLAIQIVRGPQKANSRMHLFFPLILLASLVWSVAHQRVLALPVLVWLASVLISYANRRVAVMRVLLAVIVFTLTSVSPVDFTLMKYPGGPHLVQVVDGLLSDSGRDAARRGELFPGGCGGAPIARWLWVW